MVRASSAALLAWAALIPSCRTWHHPEPRRVAVVVGPSWIGVPKAQQVGLRLLTEDLAESAGATVLGGTTRPQPGVVTLILGGSVTPAGIRLQARVASEGTPSQDVAPTQEDPRQQLESLLAAAGLKASATSSLLPQRPADLLPLAAVYGSATEGTDEEARSVESPATTLVAMEPQCASAHLARAESLYRRLLTKPADLDDQLLCAQAFSTSLALSPGYARAAANAGRFYIDTGNQREAMDLLFQAERLAPMAIAPRSSLAYAARTTGLLDGALTALQQRDALDGRLGSPDTLPETTYLYRGDWTRFDESLGPGPGEQPAAIRDFYRGYLRLLQGRPEEALANFKAASPSRLGDLFPILARVYELGLEGHRDEALLMLRNLVHLREGIRAPDGEFTFKIAEAFGFLGKPPEAMDLTQTAFSQGFGCTAWYERSPLLHDLHTLPRWRALMGHLQDRQKLLESRFPTTAFSAAGTGS